MNMIDLDNLRTWIGKTRVDEDFIAARHARLLADTLDYPVPERICDGQRLPPLWHWCYFLEGAPTRELGTDGHPARGGFMPPVPLTNRMWAGGRVSFSAPVLIGSSIRKVSRILDVTHKQGRSGDLVFVTVLHELKSLQGDLLISEEQDLVYKAATPPGQSNTPPSVTPSAQFSTTYTPTSAMLFRYSALTFNGHRIHYDADYCREQEGYRNLVIHGPLNATMLAGYAEQISSGSRLRSFRYRGLSPAILGNSITLHASSQDERIALVATLDDGTACMEAEAIIE
jgi:3-methylfumaryl-CoA hydratase